MALRNISTFPGGVLDGNEIEKSAAYTVVINTDSGKTFAVDSSVTFTLPSIAIGNVFKFVWTGVDGGGAITISPAAIDGVCYAGSQTDDKDLILTAATAKRGDYVILSSIDQVVSWQVTSSRGIWAKEA